MILLPHPELIAAVREAVRQAAQGTPLYLVGGAVRDLLLNRPTHDLDFVLPQGGIRIGRRVADALGAAFYPLDDERDTGRVIVERPGAPRLFLDFAAFRGPDLESDLRDRDFTLNAIAVDIFNPESAIDPTGGAADARSRILRACSPTSLAHDPVRIVRAVRLAAQLELRIEPATLQQMRSTLPLLEDVTPERLRNELFNILETPKPVTALRILERLGILDILLPELAAMRGVNQSPPHVEDVWEHTLSAVGHLSRVLRVLQPEHDPETNANWTLGLVSLRLGRYRRQIAEHLAAALNPERSPAALLLFAALYHDAGKPRTRSLEQDRKAGDSTAGDRIRFFDHEKISEDLATRRAVEMRLSNAEVERLAMVVRHHMRPLLLANEPGDPTPRAIYRFFRNTGPAGVDICLFSLADTLATYGTDIPAAVWERQVDVVRRLLEGWWEAQEQVISPPALVTGHDLMAGLGLPPGKQIGRLLEEIREAQAAGEIKDRQQALDFARRRLEK